MTNELSRTQDYENNIIIEQLNKQCGLTVKSIELIKGQLVIETNELFVNLVTTKIDGSYSINDELGNHACIVSKDTMYPTNIITPSMEVFEVCCEKCQCYNECECEEINEDNTHNNHDQLKTTIEPLTLTSINKLNEDLHNGLELLYENSHLDDQYEESKLCLTSYILTTGYETTLQLFLFQHKILDDIAKMSIDYHLSKELLLRTLIYLLKRE